MTHKNFPQKPFSTPHLALFNQRSEINVHVTHHVCLCLFDFTPFVTHLCHTTGNLRSKRKKNLLNGSRLLVRKALLYDGFISDVNSFRPSPAPGHTCIESYYLYETC